MCRSGAGSFQEPALGLQNFKLIKTQYRFSQIWPDQLERNVLITTETVSFIPISQYAATGHPLNNRNDNWSKASHLLEKTEITSGVLQMENLHW